MEGKLCCWYLIKQLLSQVEMAAISGTITDCRNKTKHLKQLNKGSIITYLQIYRELSLNKGIQKNQKFSYIRNCYSSKQFKQELVKWKIILIKPNLTHLLLTMATLLRGNMSVFWCFFFLTPAAPGFSPQYQSLLNLKKAITFYLRGNMSWEWGGNMLSIRIRGGTKELLEHYIPEENWWIVQEQKDWRLAYPQPILCPKVFIS